MDLKKRVQELAAKRRDERKEYVDPKTLPDANEQRLSVFTYILEGHINGQMGVRVNGATDAELIDHFEGTIQPNTVRRIRYDLEQHGFITKTGNKRSILAGKPKANVYMATGKWLQNRVIVAERIELIT